MGTAFLHGNGGGGNERAVWIQAYPTEAALLADVPRSQTIGVVTGTAITRCCIQPTVPGSTEGWIWIKDNSSTWVSNHLQVINGTGNPPTYVPVFPSGCMQYINGAWKNKIAYFYKGGKWVQFSSTQPDREYLIQGGVIDMTAHPHSATDNKTAVNSYDYNGHKSLSLAMANGRVIEHVFSNVAVPAWANTMKIHYYLLPSYQYDPVFGIGGASVSITRSSDQAINEGTAQIDVKGIASTTVAFKVKAQGRSGYDHCYIGNAWFE